MKNTGHVNGMTKQVGVRTPIQVQQGEFNLSGSISGLSILFHRSISGIKNSTVLYQYRTDFDNYSLAV